MIHIYSDYRQIIDVSDNTEIINHTVCYDNSVNVIENKLFYSVCDVLSTDFDSLIAALSQSAAEYSPSDTYYANSEKIDYLFDCLLTAYSCLFKDEPLSAAITALNTASERTEVIKEYFNDFVNIVNYLDKIPEYEILSNYDVFERFASTYCRAFISRYDLLRSEDENKQFIEYLNKQSVPVYSVEAYLKQLEIEADSVRKRKKFAVNIKGLKNLVCSNIYYILSHSMTIKRCANCGKFFVAYNRSDTLYCDRQSPQEKDWTCKEYASKRGWYEKQRKNETAKLYRNIYQQKQMLSRRNPDIAEYKSDFERFKTAAKEWKNKVKKGEAAENDYLQWLKDVKEKKVTY